MSKMVRQPALRPFGAAAACLALMLRGAAWAQAPVANAEASSNQATVNLDTPEMLGLLSFNPAENRVDTGPFGTWYVDGVVSGLGLVQTERAATDRSVLGDLGNGQIFVQKIDGLLQFYVQAGAYAIPALGTAYTSTTSAHTEIANVYGPLPQAFVKLAPSRQVSIVAGIVPSLLGAEDSFTFQNFNIERGLLWNQEPAVSRGVQANFSLGKVTLSVSLNDGFYSNRYTWVTGSATWTPNPDRSFVLAAGGNAGRSAMSTLATPLAQNNSSVYDLVYLAVAKPFTFTPYLQYTRCSPDAAVGLRNGASTYGAAMLASATIGTAFGLSGRVEYIGATGHGSVQDATNLLYGPGSSAVSFTVTPSVFFKHMFARADLSAVLLSHSAPGLGFGVEGGAKTQVRGLLEVGLIY